MIQVSFYGNVLYCCKTNIENQNMKVCKSTENNSFYFTPDYLEKNLGLLAFYISPLITENAVVKVICSEKSLLACLKKLINYYPQLKILVISSKETLNVSDCKELEQLQYVCDIECYDMDLKLYDELVSKYHKTIKLYSEILFESSFMVQNHIITYSDLYNKKEVVIKNNMDYIDKEEFSYFLKCNHCLEKIEVYNYTKETLDYIAEMVKDHKVVIRIITENILTNAERKYLRKVKKKNNVDIQLEYSMEYKKRNAFKQLNLNVFRFSMFLLLIIGIGFVSMQHIIFARDKENTNEIMDYLVKNKPVIEEVERNVEEPMEDSVTPEEETYVNPYYHTYTNQIAELKKMNPDTVGWLQVNNTEVNHPVVVASDNEYYLNHSFDKSTNTFGWIYADFRSHFDVLNQNTIIYGHHVIGTNLLFSTLLNALNANWYNTPSNLTITFNTEKENMKWQIFSIYVIPVTSDYLITNFNSPDSFLSFVQMLKNRSVKDFGVEVGGNDKILTLSTCYKDSSSRVVIHAKKI